MKVIVGIENEFDLKKCVYIVVRVEVVGRQYILFQYRMNRIILGWFVILVFVSLGLSLDGIRCFYKVL